MVDDLRGDIRDPVGHHTRGEMEPFAGVLSDEETAVVAGVELVFVELASVLVELVASVEVEQLSAPSFVTLALLKGLSGKRREEVSEDVGFEGVMLGTELKVTWFRMSV